MSDSIIAIVPAAGKGTRLDIDSNNPIAKQYRLLAGQPMLRLAVCALLAEPRIKQVRVAVAADDERVEPALAGLARTVWRPCGGPTRAHTVAAALQDSEAHDDDWILVHDAARPGLPIEALRQLIQACLLDKVGGLLALPISDTVKSGKERVLHTIDRTTLWLAQTPQMFRAGLLRHALEQALVNHHDVTDEASAIEAAGYAPLLIPGAWRNFKVTWAADFELMEKFL